MSIAQIKIFHNWLNDKVGKKNQRGYWFNVLINI